MKAQSFSEAQNPVPDMLHVIETVISGVRMIRTWQRRWLRVHLVAGVTIFAMLVQQGMALAGGAPVAGLYPAIGSMVGYALFWEFTTVDVLIEQDHIFLTVSAAVQTFLESKGE